MIENVLFEHAANLTAVHSNMQPRLEDSLLTLVDMVEPKPVLEEAKARLRMAMKDANVDRKELKRSCHISLATIGYWLNGHKLMSADNADAVGPRLKVNPAWLRVKSDIRELPTTPDQRAVDDALDALEQMREPLQRMSDAQEQMQRARAAFLAVLDRIGRSSGRWRGGARG